MARKLPDSDLLNYYAEYVPDSGHNKYQYSHINYALLEIILERIYEKSYPDIIKESVFDLLKMEKSFVEFDENNTISPGYDRAMRPVSPWSFNSFAASEGIKSSAYDLSLYLRGMMDIHNTPLAAIIDTQLQITEDTDYSDRIKVANGWLVLDQGKDYQIFNHTGKTSGHTAFIAFIRNTKTGVIILSNSSAGVENLGFLIMRMINYNWKRKT